MESRSVFQAAFEEPGPWTTKERFMRALQHWAKQFQEIHDSLARFYPEEALKDIEDYFYDAGTDFNEMVLDQAHPFYDWVNRSDMCKKLVGAIVDKADQVSISFGLAIKNGYARAVCKRLIHNLILEIQNLGRLNETRAD